MTPARFQFASGNLAKLLALPKYVLSLILSWLVPRDGRRWAFGSDAGVAEGALPLARALRERDPAAEILWLVANDAEAADAEAHGFTPVPRVGRRGFWATLRAGTVVVTHGLGDVNRYGVTGARVVQLWHGAPLKRLHLDSPVTTQVSGPPLVRGLLRRMYLAGAREVDLYVAGSPTAADRLRSAFRVAPGKVRVLGDPRDDVLAVQARDPSAAQAARADVLRRLGVERDAGESLVLYAPTWRDGDADPAVPTEAEAAQIRAALERTHARLVIRSHPLGGGASESLLGDRIHVLDAATVRDITPLLGGFDTVVTDYSSVALDFSLLGRPIVWFAPDLEAYERSRGLYEPLTVTSGGRVVRDWAQVVERLESLATNGLALRAAEAESRALAARFHAFPEGGAAERVLAAVRRIGLPAREIVTPGGIFFESFYGRQVSDNPAAIDREIAGRYPDLPRYWSVTSERQAVPEGATPVLVGGPEWYAARSQARLLVVNDWLRGSFRRRRGQTVLQTWHGTMLKHLALGRPNVRLRTRLAILRERRRWNLLLSQNPHASAQFRSSYAYSGEIIETGYPRADALARAMIAGEMNPVTRARARAALGVAPGQRVLAYAPTWRDGGVTIVDDLRVHELAAALGEEWTVVVRGHTRTLAFGGYGQSDRVVDASKHPDVADVLLAADLLVTDYSSIMFDAAITRAPMLFFVPHLAAYRDRERGFTFDFEASAPGPLLSDPSEVVRLAHAFAADGTDAAWVRAARPAADAWRERFVPHDDGHAAERVVDELVSRGALPTGPGSHPGTVDDAAAAEASSA